MSENGAISEITLSDYDAVPYPSYAIQQSHPDRLATVAALFGMRPAPVPRCRVLELGCADGGNLIPMAAALPQSQFVGIDLSARQIADGQAMLAGLNLENISLEHRGILDVGQSLGKFDYIIVHGVYSWVPPQVQDKILRICREQLNPQGVAFISYNTYPGWHLRGTVREMIQHHTRDCKAPADRIRAARELLALLARGARQSNANWVLLPELVLLGKLPDTYLMHEHLEEFNEPLYFHQFARRAAARGLQYLGEAHFSAMVPGNFSPELEGALRGISRDLIDLEQYMDFLRNRPFRQTLLCHEEINLQRALSPKLLADFFVASPARPVSADPDISSNAPVQYRGRRGGLSLTSRDPLMKSALALLGESWPRAILFAQLCAIARKKLDDENADHQAAAADRSQLDQSELGARILHCYSTLLAELSLRPSDFVLEPGLRPRANSYIRALAAAGNRVTNLRHEPVEIAEVHRKILPFLDGGHDQESLAGLATLERNIVREALLGMARASLLES
jgi:methyltransferase-like protein/2-polyprenyl-3-methyl-5-hydroxy-6-metoxy-1,4-benzoquinol methylase